MTRSRPTVGLYVLSLLLTALPLVLVSPTLGQPGRSPTETDTLTVSEAVEQALQANPKVGAARYQRDAAAASIREVRAGWFPTVQGQAEYRRLSDNVDYTVDIPSIPGSGSQPVTFAPAILNRYAARASIEQPVFTGFRLPSRLDAAQAHTKAASARVASTRHEVAFQTRVAYWNLYRAQAQRQAAQKGLRRLDRRLTDVRNRRDAGMATDADVLRVKARRDQLRVEAISARNDVESARRTLNDRMGRALNAPVILADTVRIDPEASERANLVARAHEQRPDIEALRQTVRARGEEVEVAQSDWYPKISLTGSYLYARPNEQLFPPEDEFQGTWQAGVRLSWEVSTGGATNAAADRAKAAHREAQYRLKDRRRTVAVEVRKQSERVQEAREAVAAARTSLQSARQAYRAVRSRSEEGMAVVSDLLDAEQELRSARARLAATQAEYALARAGLARALGRVDLEGGE